MVVQRIFVRLDEDFGRSTEDFGRLDKELGRSTEDFCSS